ncbi:MAG: asparagine synthase (glutamine-hydrolyzing) [Chitinivibrionales bacterium]|nr:asparagine synthase (glutamine-hydrolyzing) [Chitinivibrionales bacterium]
MCGICGILTYDRPAIHQQHTIRAMIASLVHRGPDGWGRYLAPDVLLGHTRLSIIDISAGHQPMLCERFAITYNGEIYNYIELRTELKAHGMSFVTNSDTEVILKAYELWGTDAVKRFNGQFAFLLWDRKERRLIVVRDRYGVRPLYVLQYEGCWYFASEVKAFDCIAGFSRSFDRYNLLEHALLWNTLGDRTVFSGVRSVCAGTFEIYQPTRQPVVTRYYEIGEQQQPSPKNFSAAKEELYCLLDDAIRLRLRSDVAVGTYLSGGIDSSAVTFMTAVSQKSKLKTFSIKFNDPDFDESSYQSLFLAHTALENTAITVSYDMLCDAFFDAAYYFERPVFRTAAAPLYLLSQQVRDRGFKVVLTGEAADEILWGYDSFKELKLLQFWHKQPSSSLRPQLIKQLYPHLRHYADPAQFGMMRMFYEGFLQTHANDLAALNIRVHNNKVMVHYFNKDFKLSATTDGLIDKVRQLVPPQWSSWTLLQRNQFLEMKTLLEGYLLSSQGDRMSLAHGVEGRYPFLDHRLVEKLFYCPDSYKLNGFSQKHLLRKTFEPYLPRQIIDRHKQPYMSPDLKTFYDKKGLRDRVRELLCDAAIRDAGIFDPGMAKRFLQKHEQARPDTIGYRDNMLISFMISTQIIHHNFRHPRQSVEKDTLQTVDYHDI